MIFNFIGIISGIFSANGFEPHSVHFAADQGPMWLIVAGNALSVLAYVLIPTAILYVVWKRKDLVYNWMFLLFGAFIALCGITHALHIMIFWYPAYYLEAAVEVVTLIVSFATFLMFLYIIPTVVKLTSPEQMEGANAMLAKEVKDREETEQELNERNKELEKTNEEILTKNEELAKLNGLTTSREERLSKLKKEIDEFKNKSIIS